MSINLCQTRKNIQWEKTGLFNKWGWEAWQQKLEFLKFKNMSLQFSESVVIQLHYLYYAFYWLTVIFCKEYDIGFSCCIEKHWEVNKKCTPSLIFHIEHFVKLEEIHLSVWKIHVTESYKIESESGKPLPLSWFFFPKLNIFIRFLGILQNPKLLHILASTFLSLCF